MVYCLSKLVRVSKSQSILLTGTTDVYYLNFPDDKLFAKCLGKQLHIAIHLVNMTWKSSPVVYGTYLFETVQTCLSAVDLYYW